MDIEKLNGILNKARNVEETPYMFAHQDLKVNERRSPYDPITITDSHALMALTIAGLMSEMPPEQFLLELIDSKAQEYYADLGRDMLRQYTYLTREEYDTVLGSAGEQAQQQSVLS